MRLAILLALGAVDYELSRPWRLFVVLATVVYLWQWTAFSHRREAIRVIRQRRHRLGNQLQLALGWLQLGNTARAEETLSLVMESERAQSQWFRHLPSRWTYLFLRWDSVAEERGIGIAWLGIPTLSPTYRMAWMLERRLSQAMDMVKTAVTIEFYGHGFRIYMADVVPGHLPPGWQAADPGIEYWWRRPVSANAPNSSAPM